jgi:hypothetical protein
MEKMCLDFRFAELTNNNPIVGFAGAVLGAGAAGLSHPLIHS